MLSLHVILVIFLFGLCCVPHSQGIQAPVSKLNNGYTMPLVGLGTYGMTGAQCEQAVKDAIDIGYRHIDTAFLYTNEKEVGNAVRAKIGEGIIRREDVFITTKLWDTFHEPHQVALAFQKSMDNLNLSYIDLYLMHSPEAYQLVSKTGLPHLTQSIDDVELFPKDRNGHILTANIDYVDTWRAMEQLLSSGAVRSIGISNFEIPQVERLLSMAQIKPVTNQVECHPNRNQRELINYCTARDVVVTAYSPLGRPYEAHGVSIAIFDPNVQLIANRYNKTSAQVILRYTIQNGGVVIPKSTRRERIAENINIFDFELDANEMAYLNALKELSY